MSPRRSAGASRKARRCCSGAISWSAPAGFERSQPKRPRCRDNTKLVRAEGLKVHLVDMPFEQPLGRRGAREVWARQLRWARLRRVSFPLLFFPEVLVGSALPTAALATALWAHGPAAAVSAMILLPALWLASEAALA